MYVDWGVKNLAEAQKACAPYEEYAQCHACGWLGCVGDFAGHVRAKHPEPAPMLTYWR